MAKVYGIGIGQKICDMFIYTKNKLKKRMKEMKKVPTEEEMFEAIKKNPRIMEIWGALKDIIPEAVVDVKERRKRYESPGHSRD